MPDVLQGKGVISGIAIGKVMLVSQNIDGYLAAYDAGDSESEIQKVHEAIRNVVADLEASVKMLKAKESIDRAAIMEAHLMMAQDSSLESAIIDKVTSTGSAPRAILYASEEYAAMFEGMDDAYLKERAVDIRDVGRRIAKRLLGVPEPEFGDEAVILCGHEIEPSVIANIPSNKIGGVILGQGSTTCHAVIIAKARAITTVVGLGKKVEAIKDGTMVLIDGDEGEVLINPDERTIRSYQKRLEEQKRQQEHYAQLAPLPAITTDGVKVQLAANIGSADDVKSALTYGCEGVGLFRTEFVFMGKENIPTEEDQYLAYKKAVEKCAGNICVIRTMDIGGDKPLAYLDVPPEDNPFLGWRALRISLTREDLFIPQLKAILRAGVYGKAAIMLPMVISVTEINQVKTLLEKAKNELIAEGKEYSEDVSLGIMVETTAAAVMAPVLAKHVDFFSIGTNDLVQYTLAVDRVNHNVAYLYSHFHPAVLRLIYTTIKAARDHNIWAGMCGEMASDPAAAVLLLGMGIHELSMSAPSIPKVKEKIRKISFEEAKVILEAVLQLETAEEVKEYLKNNL